MRERWIARSNPKIIWTASEQSPGAVLRKVSWEKCWEVSREKCWEVSWETCWEVSWEKGWEVSWERGWEVSWEKGWEVSWERGWEVSWEKGWENGGGDSSVVRAPDSWLKGRGFESLLERRENFILQCRLSVLTLISVSVPSPCYRSST